MEDKKIPIERQLEVYKQFYQEELRKREEAEKGIKYLEKLLADYQDMLYKESARMDKELEDERIEWSKKLDDEKSKFSEISETAGRLAEVKMLNFFVQLMACSLVIPVLSKLCGCSWTSFFKELLYFPSSVVSLIILLGFVESKISRLHHRK